MTLKSKIKSLGANLLSNLGALDYLLDREPSWRILMYHRVCNPEELSYPIQHGMYVRPDTFKMHCEYLKENTNVILVDELVNQLLNNEKLPKRTVAITFDDGWRDNLENAFPTLKALGLPATVFLPTEYIGTNKLFWTDQVAQALVSSPELFINYPGSQIQNLQDKLELIINYLFSLSSQARDIELTKLTKLTKNLSLNTQREFLTWEEVLRLDLFGVKVGSHSHSHRLFKELTLQERLQEFQTSRDILQHKACLTSRIFVFPGGSHTLEMSGECLSTGYLACLKTTLNYNPNSQIFPRIGIHEDISNTECMFKFRLALT